MDHHNVYVVECQVFPPQTCINRNSPKNDNFTTTLEFSESIMSLKESPSCVYDLLLLLLLPLLLLRLVLIVVVVLFWGVLSSLLPVIQPVTCNQCFVFVRFEFLMCAKRARHLL